MILMDHEVSPETSSLLPFYHVDGKRLLNGERTCRKRGSSPFSFSLMDLSLCSQRCYPEFTFLYSFVIFFLSSVDVCLDFFCVCSG